MNTSSFSMSIVSLVFSIVALGGVLGVIAVQIILLIKIISGSVAYGFKPLYFIIFDKGFMLLSFNK